MPDIPGIMGWEDYSIIDRETRQYVIVLGWAAKYRGPGGL